MFWFGLVLRHINPCRLFNAKSIFIHTNNSISNISVYRKNSFNVKNTSISNNSVEDTKTSISSNSV